jgi:hypothetical protein
MAADLASVPRAFHGLAAEIPEIRTVSPHAAKSAALHPIRRERTTFHKVSENA